MRRTGTEIDARSIGADFSPDFDVCIVGGGPAGIAAALALNGRGLRIAILEAGDLTPTIAGQRMLAASQSGSKYWSLQTSRYLALGGAANRWGGICRPLDEGDFEARPWVDHSGWPIGVSALEPYYKAAAEFLQLPTGTFEPPAPTADGAVLDINDEDFTLVGYEKSPLLHFGRVIRDKLAAATDVTVVLNAFVTELGMSTDSDVVDRVAVRSANGVSFDIRPKSVLLCAGAIENARLLLMSRKQKSAGVGNEYGLVGRYFMEHLHAPMGHLITAPTARLWSTYDLTNPARPQMTAAISPTPELIAQHRLVSASVAVGPTTFAAEPPFISWPYPLIPVLDRAQIGMELHGGFSERAASRGMELARRSRSQISTLRMNKKIGRSGPGQDPSTSNLKSVYIRGEQVPLAGNRVTLGSAVDRFGRPKAALTWTVDEQSLKSAEDIFSLFRSMIVRKGLGTIVGPYPEWHRAIVGGPHHMGTTRMATSPSEGVTNADGRVHSVKNLYVAGSSLFTTGGHANPTFAVIALSLLVADALAHQLQRV